MVRCWRPSRQARPWQRTPREPVAIPGTARATAAMGPRRTARTYAGRRSLAHGTPEPSPPWLPGTTPGNTVGATRGQTRGVQPARNFKDRRFTGEIRLSRAPHGRLAALSESRVIRPERPIPGARAFRDQLS